MGNAPRFLQPLDASQSCDDDASSSRLQTGEWDKYGGTSRFFRRTGSGTPDYGSPMDESRQLVILLSSLPSEYELSSSIVENAKDITLTEVKEKLLKESGKMQRKETTEKAFRVNGNPG
uniref:Uncharacterized protein n=1 Tax=Peronospora matthiolae TaxID=2874970 RepID=A0AAV1T318_9STRA